MRRAAAYRNKAVIMEMMAAFTLYKDEGMPAVKRMYPQHAAFVHEHAGKTITEVKRELLEKQAA
jgi:hypothetical protein